MVPQEQRQGVELGVEVGPDALLDAGALESDAHAAHPRRGHPVVDRHAAVAHPQPWMPVPRDVVLRSAEPADEEEGEPVTRLPFDAAIGVAWVEAGEIRLELGHRVVEALYDGSDRCLAAQAHERRIGFRRKIGAPLIGRGHGGELTPSGTPSPVARGWPPFALRPRRVYPSPQ